MKPSIVLLRPETLGHDDLILAEGMRVVWASALIASGADPVIAAAGMRKDGCLEPPTPAPDAIVSTKFVRERGSIRIITIVRLADRVPVMRSGRTFRGATAELCAMAATLHTIAGAVWLDLPPQIGWRDLTFTQRAAPGIAHLRETGRDFLARSAPAREAVRERTTARWLH